MSHVALFDRDGHRNLLFEDFDKGGLAVADVKGYNYSDPGSEEFHQAHPKDPVIGTETVSAVGTRGIYVTDHQKGFVGSYDPYTTTGRASAEGWWRFCNARRWLAGGFIWTGFDYRGEPGWLPPGDCRACARRV